MIKWFVLENENVLGPYETEEIKKRHRNGLISDECQVWSRLQADWMPASEWSVKLEDLISSMDIFSSKSRFWHYSFNGETFGPIGRDELIDQLKGMKNYSKILLWTSGMDKWEPLIEFHDILDEIGVNRRDHLRAPIEGTVTVTKESGDLTAGKLVSISEGGIGYIGMVGLHPGEQANLEIISDNFNSHLRVKAQVRYISENNFVGLSFVNPPSEVKSQIIEYVKNAKNSSQLYKSAA